MKVLRISLLGRPGCAIDGDDSLAASIVAGAELSLHGVLGRPPTLIVSQ